MIEIIDLLKPKNGGSFKLIEDIDIAVNGYSSLADCVAHMATTAMIEAINAALSGKQDKLTTAQLTAVNSGITSELVAQISLNETALTGKADAGDLISATANLQGQIDQIEISATAETVVAPEVAGSRVGVNGVSYQTLKERLDSEIAKTNEDIYNIYHSDAKTFSLSDIESDGTTSYYFMYFPMKTGKQYTVTFTKGVMLYLRADKYTRPSVQTIGAVQANVPTNFTATANVSWITISVTLEGSETFTCSIVEKGSLLETIDSNVSTLSTNVTKCNFELSQFVEISATYLNESDFIVGGRATYNGAPTSVTNRATYHTNILTPTENFTVIPDSSAKHHIFFSDGTKTGWITEPFTFEKNESYTYVISYADDRTISDIGDLCEHFTVTNAFQNKVIEIDRALNIIDATGLGSEYYGKKISILGDSLSTFGGSASDDPSERISDGTYTYAGNRCRYPQTNLLTDVNNTYWKQLIDNLHLVLGINESWAGSRVSWDGTTESADIGANKHIASATRIGHLGENGTPDIILINGGTNDIGGNVPVGTFNTENPMNYTDEQIAELPVSTFADAYRTMLIRLQKSYPTSRIFVLLPNYTTSYYTPAKADEYCEVIKEACDYFGVKWLDMRASGITMFNRGTYLPDGIHYNANGMNVVAKNVKKFMQYNFTV